MTLVNKTKIYMSLDKSLLEFVDSQSDELNITRSKYISGLLLKEYNLRQKRKIDMVIEGNIGVI